MAKSEWHLGKATTAPAPARMRLSVSITPIADFAREGNRVWTEGSHHERGTRGDQIPLRRAQGSPGYHAGIASTRPVDFKEIVSTQLTSLRGAALREVSGCWRTEGASPAPSCCAAFAEW